MLFIFHQTAEFLKTQGSENVNNFFVDKAKSLTNGKYEINTNIYGVQSKFLDNVCPQVFITKLPPNVKKPCDYPDCMSVESYRWTRFDGYWHAFHISCLNGKDYCPICQCFLKQEITKLGNIAKNGVTSLAGDNRVDEPSSKNCEQEVDPSVPETTYSDFIIQISVLVKEILDLQPKC